MTTTSQRDLSLRIDIPRKDLNIIDSSIARLKCNSNGEVIKTSIISSPISGGDIDKEDIKERLSDVLYRSMNYSSKLVGVDELTGKRYSDDETRLYIISGVGCRNTHHCAGNIVYHPDSSYMLKWIDLMFWEENGVIVDNSLEGNLTVLRGSGEKDNTAYIEKDEAIRWSNTINEFVIKVKLDKGDKEKHVSLHKIHEYNPDMTLSINLPSRKVYEGSPNWVLELYDSWISFIDKIKLGSSKIVKTYYEDTDF